MPKRLLYLTAEEWPTFRVDLTTLFGQELPHQGIQTDLVTERKGAEPVPAWPAGQLRLCAPGRTKADNYVRKFVHLVWQAFMAGRGQIDAIQVRDMPVVAAFSLVAARLRRVPFFYWMSYPQSEGQVDRARQRGPGAGLRYWFPLLQGLTGQWLLYRFVLPRADHVFVQSDQMAREVATKGVPMARMTAVPMGVDPAKADPRRVQPTDDPRLAGRHVIVYLGSLDRTRQIDVLVQAMPLVRAQQPDALLVLAGDADDDDQRAHIRQLVQHDDVRDSVLWTGWMPMQEAWRYVRAAEVAVSPVPRSPLLDVASPTKVLEYMALEMPVLVNDNPDQQQVVAAAQAGLCAPYEPAAFAQALVSLLRTPLHERQAMGQRGRAYVQAHRSYAHLAQQVARVYHRLMP
jgi:glycosyltransferase involved in cell wall biosynthesis